MIAKLLHCLDFGFLLFRVFSQSQVLEDSMSWKIFARDNYCTLATINSPWCNFSIWKEDNLATNFDWGNSTETHQTQGKLLCPVLVLLHSLFVVGIKIDNFHLHWNCAFVGGSIFMPVVANWTMLLHSMAQHIFQV